MNYSNYKLSVFLTPRSGKTGDTTLPEVINDIVMGVSRKPWRSTEVC